MVFAAVPGAKISLCNYDERAIPMGKGFAGHGNWLMASMNQAGADPWPQQANFIWLPLGFTQHPKARNMPWV